MSREFRINYHENRDRHNARLRIFYTQAQGESAKLFSEIEEDIFSVADAKIYYEESEDQDIFEKIKEMHVVVFPVTERLLSGKNSRTMKLLHEAISLHIPMLPLLQTEHYYREMEAADAILKNSQELSYSEKIKAERDKENASEKLNSFIAEYNKDFNNRQFLEKACRDKTALPFRVKLQTFLNSFLVDEALEKLIKSSFDAHIFMSYRKRDREDMQKLMQLIHNEKEFENIAIWYDEFLVPGRKFDEVLKEKIQQSDLMMLAVTPNLLAPDNYVHEHEYPFAVDNNIRILPIEITDTEMQKFKKMYPGLEEAASVEKKEELISRLAKLLSTVAWSDRMDDPKHTFYLGMAYLYGIDTNTDRMKGTIMIKDSAEQGYVDAIEKRAGMFMFGEVEDISLETALELQAKAVRLREDAFVLEGSFENAVSAGLSRRTLGDFRRASREEEYRQALKWFEAALDLAETDASKDEALCGLESLVDRFWITYYQERIGILKTLADHHFKDYSVQNVIDGYEKYRHFTYYDAWKSDLDMNNYGTYIAERTYLEERFEKGAESDPDRTIIVKRLKELYLEDFPMDPTQSKLQTPDSIKKGLELLKQYPESPEYFRKKEDMLVDRLLLKRRYPEALALLDEIKETGSEPNPLLYAQCYRGLKEYEKAAGMIEPLLEPAIEQIKQSKDINDALRNTYRVIKILEELKEDYEGIDRDPEQELKYEKIKKDIHYYKHSYDQLRSDLQRYLRYDQ